MSNVVKQNYDFRDVVGKADLNLKEINNYAQEYKSIAKKINFADPDSMLQFDELMQLVSKHQLNLLSTVLNDYHQKYIQANSL